LVNKNQITLLWKEITAMEQKIEFICEWRTGKQTIQRSRTPHNQTLTPN